MKDVSLFLLATAVKILLVPSYRSTDFEVHRNWLALTHTLPLQRWYYEDTSPWTLDYPPLFAWFEYALSFPARWVDKEMVTLSADPYVSPATVVYQRTTVMVSDVALLVALRLFSRGLGLSPTSDRSQCMTLAVLLFFHPGLLFVDHIHFQYNGVLIAILIISYAFLLQGKDRAAAFTFALLLNLKHVFLYFAPIYFLYLLKHYCLIRGKNSFIARFMTLAGCVLVVFLVSLGPFALYGQLGQVLARLFPFKRGLCHAYWAPNLWALYNVLDKGLAIVLRVDQPMASLTGGLVGTLDGSGHVVLPQVTPTHTLLLILLGMLPSLLAVWKRPTPRVCLYSMVCCGIVFFLFGWHVHEKALLTITVPLGLLAVMGHEDAEIFLLLSTVGNYALFPLLFRPQEYLLKTTWMLLYVLVAFTLLSFLFSSHKSLLRRPYALYLLGLVPLELFTTFLLPLTPLGNTLPFLPLLLISAYCSLGVCVGAFLLHQRLYAIVQMDRSNEN